ncbi:MAG: hypothetical protein IJT85_00910 [Ruminococcus sp.]|nr:hypothetical protein [Ruminococcus sp.]
MGKFTVLFGAGAEECFHLPSGSDYTKDTILTKKDNLYETLRKFYKKRETESYSQQYKAEYLFRNGQSHTLRELVARAARDLRDNPPDVQPEENDISYDFVKQLGEDDSAVSEDIKKLLEKKYKLFISSESKSDDDNSVKLLEKHYSYHGTVEKDFSTIINPKEAGIYRFWRLINYFWSAYFSILIPILKNEDKYKDMFEDSEIVSKQEYKFCLDNLNDIIDYIYNEGYKHLSVEKDKDYYCILKENLMPDYVATTNYTPFVKRIGLHDDRISYLAGKLSTFEFPNELEVIDYDSRDEGDKPLLSEDRFVFPFIMTQAPVKPIVSTYQFREYSKFIDALDNSETVVIIGFSLGENDNHINSLLHDYIKSGRNLIYCQYCKDESLFDEESERKKVSKALHIDETNRNIQVVCNTGNATNLIDRLKPILKNIGC